MRSRRNTGRIVGALVLLHFAVALALPFILLDPVIPMPQYQQDVVASSTFLETAAANAAHVRAPVLLFLFGAAVALGVSIAAYPVLQEGSRGLALWCLVLAIANFPLQSLEAGLLLSMLSLSQQYAQAGAVDGAMLQPVGLAVSSARMWTHLLQLLTIVGWILTLFAALWRASQIPRVLGVFGVAACALQMSAVPLRGVLGYTMHLEFGTPLAPACIALALWLIVKGFNGRNAAARQS